MDMYVLPTKSAPYLLMVFAILFCHSGISSHACDGAKATCEPLVAAKETFYRESRLTEKEFVVLAYDCKCAQSLADAVRNDLELLRTFLNVRSLPSKGVIVAIESKQESWPGINTHDSRYAESTETFHWNPRPAEHGRKYVRSHAGPYFRLSFALNKNEIREGFGKNAPDFVVFLTTDEYYQEVSQELESIVSKNERQANDASGLLSATFAFMRWRLAQLDLYLMQLGRREVLWLAVLEASNLAPEVKVGAREKIIATVNAEWKSRFANRPMD